MMANKFYIKRKKERKKKNSFSSASDRFSRKTRTKNTSAFFFQRSRVVFKVTVRDPETPLISKIFNHRRRGTKTRLVLGSGQPRQRVMKTFPSFFLLFPFLLFPFFFPFFFCTETTITNDPVACNEGPRRVTTETSCRYPFVSFRGCTTSAISLFKRVSIGPTTTTMSPLCIDLQC